MNRKTWLSDVLGTEKAAVGVVHFKAFPSDPLYDAKGGLNMTYHCSKLKVFIDLFPFNNDFC